MEFQDIELRNVESERSRERSRIRNSWEVVAVERSGIDGRQSKVLNCWVPKVPSMIILNGV